MLSATVLSGACNIGNRKLSSASVLAPPLCEIASQSVLRRQVKYFHQWHQTSEGKGVDYIFVDHPCFHRPGGLYYNQQLGVEYADNLYRFALFCLASIEAPVCVAPGGAPYGDKVMFIANDWQTALLPVYLTHKMRPWGRFVDSRCLFIVHNFGYQGIYPLNKLENNPNGTLPIIVPNVGVWHLGLDGTGAYEHLIFQYPLEQRSYDGDDGNVWNLTKGAVLTCDRIVTVSAGYAAEMKTPEGGFRLDALVRSKEFFLTGILNGIDVAAWNPRTDSLLEVNYSPTTFVDGAPCGTRMPSQPYSGLVCILAALRCGTSIRLARSLEGP